jgi:hypothetical protein
MDKKIRLGLDYNLSLRGASQNAVAISLPFALGIAADLIAGRRRIKRFEIS